MGRGALALPGDDGHGNAGEPVDNGCGPTVKRAVAGAIGVVGTVEVEALVLRGRLGGDALTGGLGQGGATLSANITETPATFGITVGRWR